MDYLTISMRELDHWIASGRPMKLIDLRSRESFLRCHLEGADNIPFDELEQRLEELRGDIPNVFYCSRGSQSMLACNHLSEMGYPVVNAGGGLAAYRGRHFS